MSDPMTEDEPTITTRRTGAGELPPREISRSGPEGVAETLPRERDRIGSGADPQHPKEGPVISGIPGAPNADSVLGKERGPSRPPHDPGEV